MQTPDHLWFLESMDRVHRAIQASGTLERALDEVLAVALDGLRATHACALVREPGAPVARIAAERRQGDGGTPPAPRLADGAETEAERAALAADGPVVLAPATTLAQAVHPRIGSPWVLLLRRDDPGPEWLPGELRLFQEIGRRLADALSNLLATRELEESRRRLAETQRLARVGHWGCDVLTSAVALSPEARQLFGASSVPLVLAVPEWLERWADTIHPDDRPGAVAAVTQAIAAASDFAVHYRLAGDEPARHVTVVGQAQLRPDGSLRGMTGYVQDVTDVARAEEARRMSQLEYRDLFDTAGDAMFYHGPRGEIVDVNSRACESLGYTHEEIMALGIRDLDPVVTVEQLREISRKLDAGELLEFESTHRRKDGTEFPVEIRMRPVIRNGRRYALASVRDIESRRRLEEQLRHAQKMEAVGTLAGGVAHDFNNLLTVIIGQTELALADVDPGSEIAQSLRDTLGASRRAARLTGQLLAFSRKQVLRPEVVDAADLLRRLVRMLERMIGEDITLTLDVEPGDIRVRVDAGMLEQAITNLAVNARQAMPSGGRLHIAARVVDGTREGEEEMPPCVEIVVSDTGIGMDEETRKRAFDPFFTTRPDTGGTGLGLAMVFGFVTQSGGTISIESDPGRGTSFRILLPQSPDGREPVETDVPAELAHGTETVLLVEDADAVRSYVRTVLEGGGYHVLVARDGAAAIDVFHRSPTVDVLLTDYLMPHMTGVELARALRLERPDLPVLVMSGYAGDGAPDRDGLPLITKPFRPAELTTRLRDLLATP